MTSALKCHDRTRDHVEQRSPREPDSITSDARPVTRNTTSRRIDRDVELAVHGLPCSTRTVCRDQDLANHVTGFRSTTHPKFEAYLLASGTASGRVRPDVRLAFRAQPDKGARESSNSEVSARRASRRQQGTQADDSKALGCGDCHRLAPDMEHFLPVTMEAALPQLPRPQIRSARSDARAAAWPADGSDPRDRRTLPAQVRRPEPGDGGNRSAPSAGSTERRDAAPNRRSRARCARRATRQSINSRAAAA